MIAKLMHGKSSRDLNLGAGAKAMFSWVLLACATVLAHASATNETAVRERPWVVVTGASSGIGRSIAAEAASRGHNLVLAARHEEALKAQAVEYERAHGVSCVAVAVDLSTENGAHALHNATKHLQVELLVANAGVPHIGEAVEQPLDSVSRVSNLNVNAVAMLCRLYGADMKAQRRGAMLLTSSLTSIAALPQAALYGASRAFVTSLARALRTELSPYGVGVTCLMPGATDTNFGTSGYREAAMIFNFPLAREVGLVLSSDAVALVGLNAVASGVAVAVPGFLNRCYALSARLMTDKLASDFSAACFGEDSPISSPAAFVRSLPTLLPAIVALIVALPAQSAIEVADWATCKLLPLLVGPAPRWPPAPTTLADGAVGFVRLLLAIAGCLLLRRRWRTGSWHAKVRRGPTTRSKTKRL
jgi:short-subunit dehydrogenase